MGPNPSALTGAAALDRARMGRTLGTVSLMLCSRSRFALRCHVRQGATMAALPQDYKKASTQGEEKRCVYPHAAVLDCPIGAVTGLSKSWGGERRALCSQLS